MKQPFISMNRPFMGMKINFMDAELRFTVMNQLFIGTKPPPVRCIENIRVINSSDDDHYKLLDIVNAIS